MHWIAERLRRLADRIDHKGAPKGLSWSFTIEPGRGVVFNQDGRGCPLWYLGDADYDRAHDEASPALPTLNFQGLFSRVDVEGIVARSIREYSRRLGKPGPR